MTITVHAYSADNASEWNAWVAASKNGTFLHDRRFMDYHAGRFEDASMIVRSAGKPIALFPANRSGDAIISHGGLTYGGMIVDQKMRTAMCLDVFSSILNHARAAGADKLLYKPVPHIYHRQPAEEDLYAIFRSDGRLIRCDASAAIPLRDRPRPSKSRLQAARAAQKAGVEVRETGDWPAFWVILTDVLSQRHDASPTHSLDEIKLLASRFPEGIRLFGAFHEGKMIAGLVTFDCGPAIHVQYIAASPKGRDLGGVDIVVAYLTDTVFANRDWFDFGISTTNRGLQLNEGLAQQKEMFGARCVVYQQFEIDL